MEMKRPPSVYRKVHKYRVKIIGILTFLTFFCAPVAHGQMFSGDDSPGRYDRPTAAVFVGWEPIDFEYQGDAGVLAAGTYGFSGSLLRVRFEGSGANVYLGAGGGLTGLDESSYFDAGIRYGYGIGLIRSPNFSLGLPIVLHSSFTSVSNDDMVVVDAPQFEQGTFEFGGGLSANVRLTPKLRLAVQGIPSYGFSFSTRERDASGSISAIKGEGRLYFDHLFGKTGLSLGYDYNMRRFDIEGQVLDYDASAHSFLIGLTF